MGRKVLTIDRCTQEKWVPDGRRSKRFTLQIYEKQRVRASSPCILFPYRPQQKHADAKGVGVAGNKREGDRRKPRERRHNPRNRWVGGTGNPQSSTRIRSGGGRRWRTCIKRWNVATLSPRRRGDTARPIQGDRRKPRERRRNPRNRRVGGTGNPQSSTRIRSGGGRRWRTCIKRWNVATLSPRRRGDTARPTQGDRRKPRERRRNPRSRRVGGHGKPSVLHPNPQRRRQTVERMHQAVERRHALPQTEGRHRAANQHTT